MKGSQTTTILNWALAVVVAATVIFATQYVFKTKEARALQAQIVGYQNKQAVLNNLIAECLEYSKRNPAIDPLLEANNLKPKANAPAKQPAR
jgi:hypothetical protein